MNPDPIRKKCQYDYMLEEMRLMANDFLEERRWKVNVAYILAHEAKAFYFRYLYPRIKAREDTLSDSAVLPFVSSSNQGLSEENQLAQQHKRIGHLLSEMVQDFWGKVHVVNEEFAQAHGMQCELGGLSASNNNNNKEGGECEATGLQITLNQSLLREDYLRGNGMEIEGKPELANPLEQGVEMDIERVDEETTIREVYESLQEQTVSQSIRICCYNHLPICVTYHDDKENQSLLEGKGMACEVEQALHLLCQQMDCCSQGRGLVICEER